MYADYVVTLRIIWPCSLPKMSKIRAALLKLLALMRGPMAHPVVLCASHLNFVLNFVKQFAPLLTYVAALPCEIWYRPNGWDVNSHAM